MRPELWERAKEIFLEALELPAEARAAVVRDRCRDDAELRQEVLRLLAHHEVLDGAEAAPGGTGPAQPLEVGQQIGPYTIVRLLGEGGMGAVYEAVRERPIRQTVAIKVIKPGMDSRQIISRFEAERQTLALMDHPHIARIFDAGMTPGGHPYFVMERVNGQPITAFCDQQQMSVPRRLELFAQVCQAVQHAHQKGVIHRDLKPSNLLVELCDGAPSVKIIDFGVAKAIGGGLLQQTLFTEQGMLVGTPEYMSPEQAAGSSREVDTRTDIYSLGAVLYELLAGAPPFDGAELRRAGLERILRAIRETEPPRPSTRLRSLGEQAPSVAQRRLTSLAGLESQLRRELEWIPLKAMRKEPAQRYRSTGELADDLANYLAGRPLIAGPESAWYRARKLARRYRIQFAAAAAVLAALLGGLLGALHARRIVAAERNSARAAWQAEAIRRGEVELERDRLRRTGYAGDIRSAFQAASEGPVGVGFSFRLDAIDPDLRGWEWHHLSLRRRSVRTLIPGDQTLWHCNGPVFRSCLACDERGQVLAWLGGQWNWIGDPREGKGQLTNPRVWVWDRAREEVIAVLPTCTPDYDLLRSPQRAVECDQTGQKLVCLDPQRRATVWRIAAKEVLWRSPGPARAVFAFDPSGRHLALASHSSEVQVIDLESNRSRVLEAIPPSVIEGPDAQITALALSGDAALLGIGYQAGGVGACLLDTAERTPWSRVRFAKCGDSPTAGMVFVNRRELWAWPSNIQRVEPIPKSATVMRLFLPEAGNWLPSADPREPARLMIDQQLKCDEALDVRVDVSTVDRTRFAARVFGANVIHHWSDRFKLGDGPRQVRDSAYWFPHPPQLIDSMLKFGTRPRFARFVRDGQAIVALGCDGSVQEIGVATWLGVTILRPPGVSPLQWGARCARVLGVSADSRLALATHDASDILWDLPNKKPLSLLTKSSSDAFVLRALALSTGGDQMAVARDNDIEILDSRSLRTLIRLGDPNAGAAGPPAQPRGKAGSRVGQARFDPEGNHLYVESAGILRRCDLRTRRWEPEQFPVAPHHQWQIAGRNPWVVIHGADVEIGTTEIHVLDSALRLQRTVRLRGPIDSARLQSDGTYLSVANRSGQGTPVIPELDENGGRTTMRHYLLSSGLEVPVVRPTSSDLPLIGTPYGCQSPDGQRFATSDLNGELTISDTHTGQTLAILAGARGAQPACFTPDGKRLLATSSEGLLIFDSAPRSEDELSTCTRPVQAPDTRKAE